MPELVRALDVLLLPSWEEPFGRALIEAMALGVPVVATDVGGPREIIEDGREGYLLPPREPRRVGTGDPPLRRGAPELAAEMGARRSPARRAGVHGRRSRGGHARRV